MQLIFYWRHTLFTPITKYIACEILLFFGQAEAPICLLYYFPSLAMSPHFCPSVIHHNSLFIIQLPWIKLWILCTFGTYWAEGGGACGGGSRANPHKYPTSFLNRTVGSKRHEVVNAPCHSTGRLTQVGNNYEIMQRTWRDKDSFNLPRNWRWQQWKIPLTEPTCIFPYLNVIGFHYHFSSDMF